MPLSEEKCEKELSVTNPVFLVSRKIAQVLVVKLMKHQGNGIILTNNINWTEKIMYLSKSILLYTLIFLFKQKHS